MAAAQLDVDERAELIGLRRERALRRADGSDDVGDGWHVVYRHDPFTGNPLDGVDGEFVVGRVNDYFGGSRVREPGERKPEGAFAVYAYVHGAVAFALAPFGDVWDSGLCGWWLPAAGDSRPAAAAGAALARYAAWLNGSVYLWELYDREWRWVDSCCGYIVTGPADYEFMRECAHGRAAAEDRNVDGGSDHG